MSIKNDNNIKNDKELVLRVDKDYEIFLEWEKTVNKYSDEEQSLLKDLFNKFSKNKFQTIFFMAFMDKSLFKSQSICFLYEVSKYYMNRLQKTLDIEFLRDKIENICTDEDSNNILINLPFFVGHKYADQDFIKNLWESLNNIFRKEIKDFKGTVKEFFLKYDDKSKIYGKICFHLVESRDYDYAFSFISTYTKHILNQRKIKHVPLKNALEEYKNDNDKLLDLLSTINKASSKSSFVNDLIESGEIFYPIGLDSNEAYTFLKEIPLYEESGILCKIPNWWRKKSLNPFVNVIVGEKKESLNKDALLNFDMRIHVNGIDLTYDEIQELLSKEQGLTMLKGQWIEVDHKKLSQVLEAYDKAKDNLGEHDLGIIDALRLQLSPNKILSGENSVEVEFTNGQWLKSVLEEMTIPEKIKKVTLTNSFKATLRDYQHKGLNWLFNMKKIGLGALLADDMGLGKTVQIIALITKLKKTEKVLLVVPASLVSNWAQEIEKFAPNIKYKILHKGYKDNKVLKNFDDKASLDQGQVFITTYSMISKYEYISEINWDCLIIDEAQAIKNSSTKQAKLVKNMKANFKIALTGTPIENSLTDLWSIFDFINKGLLGSSTEFKNFVKILSNNHENYSRLKNIITPFMLRRVKTDKNIISDLPDKVEIMDYADLSKKQIALYKGLVNEIKEKLKESEEGIAKKGLILASILKFKQICNHPSLFTGSTDINFNDGGKFSRLAEICETIYQNKERLIVFTQFRESIIHIDAFLEDIFMQKGLVLHGGTSIKNRKEIVNRFQDREYIPYIILSIKAGGTGLNLTKANHVVHFDRWWNPSIENQATDRAFRIGQDKNVIVHKFVTKGTIEEKIDKIISDKSELSNKIISSNSESWITKLKDDELIDLFRLEV